MHVIQRPNAAATAVREANVATRRLISALDDLEDLGQHVTANAATRHAANELLRRLTR